METKQKNRKEPEKRRTRPAEPENKPAKKRLREAVSSGAQQPAGKARATGSKPKKTSSGQTGKTRPGTEQQTAAQAVKTRPQPQEQEKKKPAPGKKAAEKKTSEKKSPEKKLRPKNAPVDVPNRKRAYGNSKSKKQSALSIVAQNVKQTAQKRKTKRSGGKRPAQPTPAVIYTEPRAFNRNRFLVQLLTVTAVVVAFVLALSVFFKVKVITVTGADVYSSWAIREASGIAEGDNLLTFSHTRAGAKIRTNLPYVNTVRFGIKLPDTVNIIVEEAEVVYAIKDTVGQWWLMNSSGRVVEQSNAGAASKYTQVLGVTLESPAVNLQALAAEMAPTETDASGEFIPVTVTGALRLNTAMQILKALEENDIVGDAASVDVTRIEDIVLWYGNRYQVSLGDSTRLEYKVACMNDAILQMSDYESGILDISFTNWPNLVGYTPFS